jgi:hypothetical protein
MLLRPLLLGALDEQQVAAWLAQQARVRADVVRRLAQRLVERSDGNPLVIQVLLQSLLDAHHAPSLGALLPVLDQNQPLPDLAGLREIRDMVSARLERLEAPVRLLAEQLALLERADHAGACCIASLRWRLNNCTTHSLNMPPRLPHICNVAVAAENCASFSMPCWRASMHCITWATRKRDTFSGLRCRLPANRGCKRRPNWPNWPNRACAVSPRRLATRTSVIEVARSGMTVGRSP